MNKPILETIERFPLSSAGGLEFVISLYQPEGDHAPGSLPIVFVTDADFKFGMTAEMLGLQHTGGVLAPAILVGIGYGTGIAATTALRWRDLTLPTSPEALAESPFMAAILGPEIGGAEDFLSFLLDELVPDVVRRRPEAAADHLVLTGSSLGGLFTTYALFARPEAFRAMIIGSPALYWDRFAVLALAPAFGDKLRTLREKPRVFIGVGGREEELPDAVPGGIDVTLAQFRDMMARHRMIGAARDLAEDLRRRGLDNVEFRIFDDELHQQVSPLVLHRGLRFALPRT